MPFALPLLALLVVLLSSSCLSSAQYVPNPCSTPYNPWPSLTFPSWYQTAYLTSANTIPFVGSPFAASAWTIQFFLYNSRSWDKQRASSILQYGNGTTASTRLNITWDSGDHLVFDLGGTNVCTTGSTYGALVNAWHHWAFTYSFAGTGTLNIFLDGVQVCVKSSVTPALNVTTAFATPLVLGNQVINVSQGTPSFYAVGMSPVNLNNPLGGYMADFRMYSRVLSATELTAISTTGVHANNSGLTLWYQFNEGSGSTVGDQGSAGIDLNMNTVGGYQTWGQQRPQWTPSYLAPLCLFTPTALQPSGPSNSPNCQAANSTFVVTVNALDTNGNLVSAYNGGMVSLTLQSATYTSAVTITPNSAALVNGKATFYVTSTKAQYITLLGYDASPNTDALSSSTSRIQIMAAQGVYFANTTLPAYQPVNTPYNLTVFAGTCGGVVLAPGAQSPAWAVTLNHNSTLLSTASGSTLNVGSNGYASVQLTGSMTERVQFTLVNATSAVVLMGGPLTAYWTSSTVAQLLVSLPYLVNDTQPAAGSYYADSVLYLPVYAVDSVGGPVATANLSVTLVLTMTNTTGSSTTQLLVKLVNGAGYTTLVPAIVGSLTAALNDTQQTFIPLSSSVQATIVGGRAASVVFQPINATQLNVATSTSVSIQLVALDQFNNQAVGYSGSFTIASSSSSTKINGATAPRAVALTGSVGTFTFTDSNAGVVVLSLTDSSNTGLNLSYSAQSVYVVLSSSVCPAGTVSSGTLDWTGDSCGTLHNSGNLVNLGVGSGSFSLTTWIYLNSDNQANYIASMGASTTYYTSTSVSTFFIGPEQVPEAGGMSFVMGEPTRPHNSEYTQIHFA